MSRRDMRLDNLNQPRTAEFWTEVPRRWMNCPRVGEIVADLFLPFKTPLSSKYDPKVSVRNRFGVEDVFRVAEEREKKIGLWIDLTKAKTGRFYSQEEVEIHSPTKYIKIECAGHDECPTLDQTTLFIKMIEKFYKHHKDSVIAIHCTHGFNRTGFMICAYLVQVLDWSADAALGAFIAARPPGIYKSDYLEAIYERYSVDEDDQLLIPDLPDWCYEDEDANDVQEEEVANDNEEVADEDRVDEAEDDANGDGSSSSQNGSSSSHNGKRRPIPEFMSGVPNVYYVHNAQLRKEIQQKCNLFCHFRRNGFPGGQPVSMIHENKDFLVKSPYRVSWKADGVRYMLLIDGTDRVFFIDRNNDVFQVNGMNFPLDPRNNQSLTNTLLDGEMIIDQVGAGNTRPRFLVYDIVHYMDDDIGGRDFDARCRRIDHAVLGPRNYLAQKGLLDKDREPFAIRKKDFRPVKDVIRDDVNKMYITVNNAKKFLSDKFRSQLGHDVDGLIFQPYDMPYTPGRCERMLKWKPPSQCTIDFRLKVKKSEGRGMISSTVGYLYVGGLDASFGELQKNKMMNQLDGQIIECSYDLKSKKWIYERTRTDKNMPNHFTTAQAVFQGIINPLTTEQLLEFIDNKVPFFEDEIRKREKLMQEARSAHVNGKRNISHVDS